MKKIIILLTNILFYFNSFAFDMEVPQAILIDYHTNNIIFAKNSYQQVTPSSMSKLMTIYIVFDKLKKGELSLDQKFIVSEKAWKKQGSTMFLRHNEKISLNKLIEGIAVVSGNDACITVAENIAGSEEAFVDLMNIKAQEIGLKKSVFLNASGWPDPGHVMTLYDLAILAQKIISNFPEYYHYFSINELLHDKIKQTNRNNYLLRNPNIKVDGLKTGQTELGGFGLVASAIDNGRRLIGVINGAVSDKERSLEMFKLLKYGFNNFDNFKLFSKDKEIGYIEIINGDTEQLRVSTIEDINITIAKNTEEQVKYEIKPLDNLTIPIKKTTKVAKLIVRAPGIANEAIFDLVAAHEVGPIKWWQKIIQHLKHIGK